MSYMQQLVRISSKRQVTIPSKIYASLGLTQNDNLIFELKDDTVVMRKAQLILDELEGSIPVPKKYMGMPMDLIIRDAKREYFKNKK